MLRRFSIQIIAVQYWMLFSMHSTTNLNTTILIVQSGNWMLVGFANRKRTESPASSIKFQGCPEWSFGCTRLGYYGSLWRDGFWIQICQGHWWLMKWDLAKTFTSVSVAMICKLLTEMVVMGLPQSILWGICFKSGRVWCRTTIPGLSVKNGSGIHCRGWIRCPAIF